MIFLLFMSLTSSMQQSRIEEIMPISFILVGSDNIQYHLENPFDQIGEDDIKFDLEQFEKLMN